MRPFSLSLSKSMRSSTRVVHEVKTELVTVSGTVALCLWILFQLSAVRLCAYEDTHMAVFYLRFLGICIGIARTAALHSIFIPRTANLRIAENSLGVLVTLPEALARWIEDLGLFSIINKTEFDLALTNVSFCLGQEVDRSHDELKD